MTKRTAFRDGRGVAMTEFALILPIFLLIVAGILAFGRVFFYWIEANHQATETARWAAVDRNPFAPTTLQQQVATSATVEFQSDVAVCIDYPDGGTVDIGDPIRVRVQKPFSFIPLLGISTVTIRDSSTMRVERIDDTTPAFLTTENIGTCT